MWPYGPRHEIFSPFEHWDRWFESHSKHGCMSVSSFFALLCVGSGFVTGWYPIQNVLYHEKMKMILSYSKQCTDVLGAVHMRRRWLLRGWWWLVLTKHQSRKLWIWPTYTMIPWKLYRLLLGRSLLVIECRKMKCVWRLKPVSTKLTD
jgi:hypothetical protein